MLLFWLENVIIGVVNAVKTLVAIPVILPNEGKAVLRLVFLRSLRIFTFVHSVFIFIFFGGILSGNRDFSDISIMMKILHFHEFTLMALRLFVSHVISFALNYIEEREYKKTTLMKLMMQQYGRIVIVRIALLGGAFLIMILNVSVVSLVMLIFLKIILDVRAHIREHRQIIVA